MSSWYNNTYSNKLYIATVSGIGVAIAISYVTLWPLGIAALALFFNALRTESSVKRAFFFGWLQGFILVGGSVFWVFSAIPLTRIGITGMVPSIALVSLIWIVTSVMLGLASALFAALFVYLKRNSWVDILLIASVWTLSEMVRAFLFFVLTFAPQSLFGVHWTFGFSGYALAGSPALLQLASFGGVYLLGFIYASAGALLVYAHRTYSIMAIVVVLIILLYIPLPQQNLSAPTITVAAIKTSIHSAFADNTKDREKRMQDISSVIDTIMASKSTPRIILVPEDSRFIYSRSSAQLNALSLPDTTSIIGSSRIDHPNVPALSRVITYSPLEGRQQQYTKMLLVPEGEYLSNFYQSLFTMLGLRSLVDSFTNVKEYNRGTTLTPVHTQSISFAVALCSEVYSPSIMRTLSNNSKMIVALSSRSGFENSYMLSHQFMAMSKVRAVENDRYFVQAANYANSFIVSNRGVLLQETKNSTALGFISGTIPLLETRTIFSRFPYAVPIATISIMLLFLPKKCIDILRKRKHLRKSR